MIRESLLCLKSLFLGQMPFKACSENLRLDWITFVSAPSEAQMFRATNLALRDSSKIPGGCAWWTRGLATRHPAFLGGFLTHLSGRCKRGQTARIRYGHGWPAAKTISRLGIGCPEFFFVWRVANPFQPQRRICSFHYRAKGHRMVARSNTNPAAARKWQ